MAHTPNVRKNLGYGMKTSKVGFARSFVVDRDASFGSKDEHCAYLEIAGELYRMVMGILRNKDFGKKL
jgi:hypothetical protein